MMLMQMQRNIGVNFYHVQTTSGKFCQMAKVRVWAPKCTSVVLNLEFPKEGSNRYNEIPLFQESHGYWSIETDQIKPGDKYWFLLDGKKQLADPASLAQPDGVHGASQAVDLAEGFTEQKWNNIPLKDYIIYELHTGTFSENGDFDGIAKHLDHLLELGITAIEIMPVAAFPGARNWGYDGVFPFAVQSSYGGALELRRLVSLCHEKGLAVILDVVYNHVGPEGNYLGEFGPYFTNKYQTPWGDAVNFDDKGCDGVRDYVLENALMWFRDFRIDALRLDAVHAIKDGSAIHILQDIRNHVDQLMQKTGRVHYLIVESDLNDPRFITSITQNGLGMDAQWVDEFHHALRVSAGEETLGYYSDFDGLSHLAKSYRDAYVYTGMYSNERQRTFGKGVVGHPGEQFVVFSQNHDQVGNRMFGERSATLFSFEMQKLLAATVVCSPFVPMLFMGEEWAEENPFLYFIDHSDEALIDLVRKGRKAEFSAMHREGEAPDPKAERTFISSKLNWNCRFLETHNDDDPKLQRKNKHQVIFEFYKCIISLRKNNAVLRSGERTMVKTQVCREKTCLILERGMMGSSDAVVCLMNFSLEQQKLQLPTNLTNYKKIVDTADYQVSGTALVCDNPDQGISIADQNIIVKPESCIIYSASYV